MAGDALAPAAYPDYAAATAAWEALARDAAILPEADRRRYYAQLCGSTLAFIQWRAVGLPFADQLSRFLHVPAAPAAAAELDALRDELRHLLTGLGYAGDLEAQAAGLAGAQPRAARRSRRHTDSALRRSVGPHRTGVAHSCAQNRRHAGDGRQRRGLQCPLQLPGAQGRAEHRPGADAAGAETPGCPRVLSRPLRPVQVARSPLCRRARRRPTTCSPWSIRPVPARSKASPTTASSCWIGSKATTTASSTR